jgi:hypothetical protein
MYRSRNCRMPLFQQIHWIWVRKLIHSIQEGRGRFRVRSAQIPALFVRWKVRQQSSHPAIKSATNAKRKALVDIPMNEHRVTRSSKRQKPGPLNTEANEWRGIDQLRHAAHYGTGFAREAPQINCNSYNEIIWGGNAFSSGTQATGPVQEYRYISTRWCKFFGTGPEIKVILLVRWLKAPSINACLWTLCCFTLAYLSRMRCRILDTCPDPGSVFSKETPCL